MKSQDECTHTETYTEPDKFIEDDFGFEEGFWIWGGTYERGTYMDVDLHHYKCTQCGKLFSY